MKKKILALGILVISTYELFAGGEKKNRSSEEETEKLRNAVILKASEQTDVQKQESLNKSSPISPSKIGHSSSFEKLQEEPVVRKKTSEKKVTPPSLKHAIQAVQKNDDQYFQKKSKLLASKPEIKKEILMSHAQANYIKHKALITNAISSITKGKADVEAAQAELAKAILIRTLLAKTFNS